MVTSATLVKDGDYRLVVKVDSDGGGINFGINVVDDSWTPVLGVLDVLAPLWVAKFKELVLLDAKRVGELPAEAGFAALGGKGVDIAVSFRKILRDFSILPLNTEASGGQSRLGGQVFDLKTNDVIVANQDPNGVGVTIQDDGGGEGLGGEFYLILGLQHSIDDGGGDDVFTQTTVPPGSQVQVTLPLLIDP